jgi:adenylate cyclase class 2
VRATVIKYRRLFLWRAVRVHLDTVERLGTFIELEAVAPPDSNLTHEHQLIAELREVFGITDDRLVAIRYRRVLPTEKRYFSP